MGLGQVCTPVFADRAGSSEICKKNRSHNRSGAPVISVTSGESEPWTVKLGNHTEASSGEVLVGIGKGYIAAEAFA